MKTCSQCGKSKPLSEFFKASRLRDGYMPNCKRCSSAATRASRLKRPDRGWSEAKKAYRSEQVRLVNEWKSQHPCCHCNETWIGCLELHHLDPSIKDDNPSAFARSSFRRFLEEAAKCIILCSNCHKKIHAGIISIDHATLAEMVLAPV